MTVGVCWEIVQTWYERIHGRTWPTISAVIDIVSVTFVQDESYAAADESHFR